MDKVTNTHATTDRNEAAEVVEPAPALALTVKALRVSVRTSVRGGTCMYTGFKWQK